MLKLQKLGEDGVTWGNMTGDYNNVVDVSGGGVQTTKFGNDLTVNT